MKHEIQCTGVHESASGKTVSFTTVKAEKSKNTVTIVFSIDKDDPLIDEFRVGETRALEMSIDKVKLADILDVEKE